MSRIRRNPPGDSPIRIGPVRYAPTQIPFYRQTITNRKFFETDPCFYPEGLMIVSIIMIYFILENMIQ